jgi:SseB protein N-terminal domain
MSGDSTSEFTPVNMVEQQLVAAANGNLDQQRAFEKFIVDETLYVATPEVHSEGMITLKADTKIQLLNVPLNDGRQAAAVFTAPQRVGETFGEVGYMGIQGHALFELIRAQPAVLNPGQPYSVVWEPESITAMLGLLIERVVQKDTQIRNYGDSAFNYICQRHVF